MIKPFLVSLFSLLLGLFGNQVTADESNPLRLGNNILYKSDHCDIRTAGHRVLRCVGTSEHQSSDEVQMATLTFSCFLKRLSLSLSHAMVDEVVKVYHFMDTPWGDKRNDDHARVSKVRTGFTDWYNTAPRWIFRNVTHSNQTERLDFDLNTGEVTGRFDFNTTDQALFHKYVDFCQIDLSLDYET